MLAHPFTIIGAAVALGGWVFLFSGTGVETGTPGRTVFNSHLGEIANNAILLGYVLIVLGVLARIGNALIATGAIAKTPVGTEQSISAYSSRETGATRQSDSERAARTASLRASLERSREGIGS